MEPSCCCDGMYVFAKCDFSTRVQFFTFSPVCAKERIAAVATGTFFSCSPVLLSFAICSVIFMCKFCGVWCVVDVSAFFLSVISWCVMFMSVKRWICFFFILIFFAILAAVLCLAAFAMIFL